MSASPGSAPAVSFRRARNRVDRRSSTAPGDDRPYQKQRSQRATWACERCRIKKLRCMGGHPCSACRRAEIDCDFGDRGPDAQQNTSVTNQRLLQLEKAVTELVAGLSHRTHPRQPNAPIQTSPGLLSDRTYPHHHVPTPDRALNGPDVESTSATMARNMMAPASSFVARSIVTPLAHGQGRSATPERMRTVPINPGMSEGLDARWAAVQQNSAPFPPLMSHPTVWSGEPASTSPEGEPTSQVALGMTHYKADVGLRSDPVSEGIINELLARALFTLFFQKCHPLFPLLDRWEGLDSHFDHIRSSSPFLFTTIMAIAGRYYTGYREMQSSMSGLPPITVSALDALAELACAHLGFVLFRKQHQLSDVHATLLLSVWIPRGKGQSADQWMITGLCTRLAYRIGVPDSFGRPAIVHLLNSAHLDANDIHEVNSVLPQWHTCLLMNQYDTLLSLGFGRPHAMPFVHSRPRLYLTIVRKLGSSAQVDLLAATYVTCLAELSAIATDLISGLRTARLPTTLHQSTADSGVTAWSKVSALLSDLNPQLDGWERQWTWGGSYDAITLGKYTNLVKIYGEHTRLCLNSLSLNLITANVEEDGSRPHQVAAPCLARACEAAVALVQCYTDSSDAEPIVRYGGDYLVLILGQAAMFFVRVLVARLKQPLPIDQLVLAHYLKRAIEHLESNNLSTTGVCGWVAQLSRDLARYAGLDFDTEGDPTHPNVSVLDSSLPELEWDFDICALLGQNIPAGETGLDLGHYFDFAQPVFPPPSGLEAHDKANFGPFSPAR